MPEFLDLTTGIVYEMDERDLPAHVINYEPVTPQLLAAACAACGLFPSKRREECERDDCPDRQERQQRFWEMTSSEGEG